MTYRAIGMQGLGADPAPAQLTAAFMNAFVNGGGCTPGAQETMKAMACLSPQFMQVLGACYLGITPPGMNDLSFAAACLEFGKCGAFAKLGCSADELAALENRPKCLDPDGLTLSAYCRSHQPNLQGVIQGPSKDGNLFCWALSRYPTLYRDIQSLQLCGTQGTTAPTTVQKTAAPPPAATLPQVAVLYSAPCLEPDSLMMLSYCDKYPSSNGPDKYLNGLCANARTRTYQGTSYYAWGKTRPTCAAQAAADLDRDAVERARIQAAAAAQAAADRAAAQADAAQAAADQAAAHQKAEAQAAADQAADHADATQAVADQAAADVTATTHAGVSGKWVMFGLLGAVAVGGVLLWRSQR